MHYGGYLVDLPKWRAFADINQLILLEDAAHAPAVDEVGQWGNAAVFSFFTNKNMTTAEGGMVLARETTMLECIRRLRSHGMTTLTLDRHRGHAYSYDVTMLGYNYRLDELRAAMGLIQLNRLPEWNNHRRELTNIYRHKLSRHLQEIVIPFNPDHKTGAHLMPVLLPIGINRRNVMLQLRQNSIQTSIHYPPIHHFSYYRDRFP